MKGYETNKAKAKQLDSILRQKAREEGRTTLPDRLISGMPNLVNCTGDMSEDEYVG